MVSGDDELELRHELEEILPHEARLDRIAAGHELQLALRPASPLFRFDRGDEPRAPQPGKIGRVTIPGRGHKHVHRRRRGVIAMDCRDDVAEDRLPVGTRAVEKEQRMLDR